MPASPRGLWQFGTYLGSYPNSDGRVLENFGTGSQRDLGDPSQPLDQFHLFNVSSKANGWNAWINGLNLLSTTNNRFAYTTGPLLGYSVYYITYYWFARDIAEVLVYNRVLSSDERDAVSSYLNARYALVTSAPATPTNLIASPGT